MKELEIEITCPNTDCIHNGQDGKCTREKVSFRISSEQFRGRGEPDYNLLVLVIELGKCFKSKDGTNILSVEHPYFERRTKAHL